MQGNRACMALDWVVVVLLAVTLHLLALTLALLTFQVCHLFLLPLALHHFLLSRVPLALAVEGLRGGMLHGLADAWKRVAGVVRRAGRMLSVRRGLVWSAVVLAQFCQPGERMTARLARRMVGA